MRRKQPPIVNESYWMKRMFGSSLEGRVRSAAPIAATAKPSRRTVGVTSEKVKPFAWYQADSLDLNDGDRIPSWQDDSGNDRHLVFTGDEADHPVYKTNQLNGLPGGDWLEGSPFCWTELYDVVSIEQCIALCIVDIFSDPDRIFDTNVIYVKMDDGLEWPLRSENISSDSRFDVDKFDSEGGDIFLSTDAGTADGVALYEFHSTPNRLKAIKDGTVIGDTEDATTSANTDRIHGPNGSEFGMMFEIIVLTDLDDVGNIASWRSYLQDKWSV